MARVGTLRVDATRIANAASVVGCVWFAFCAFWGVARVPGGGHIGAGAAGTTLMAETSLRWHTLYPLYDFYPTVDPYPAGAYCHHPFGMYWLSMLMLRIFGHRDIVVFLPAALQSALMPILLHGIAKRVWGPIAAASAVLGFVFLPIMAGYADFHNLEVMTMFGLVLFFWGYVLHEETGRTRHLLAALLGAFIACSGDWVGYLVLGPVLGWGLLRAFVLPQWFTPPFRAQRYHRRWALSVAVAVLTLAFFVALFQRADKIGDWLGSATTRGAHDTTPLSEVLEARKVWIDFSFTPFAIAVGKVSALVAVLRFLLRRRDEELFSLAVLFGAVVQYVVFRQAADIHIFWPHYFGLYYGLALAQSVATVGWLAERASRKRPHVAAAATLAVALTVPLLVAPDTVRALTVWRATGGRYDDKGTLIRTHGDILFVLEELVRPRLHRDERVGAHASATWGWEHPWAAGATSDGADTPDSAHPFWVGRASGMGATGLQSASKFSHLRIYGDVLVVDGSDAPGPLDAYDLHEREPNVLQWLFTNSQEPVRTLDPTPDPFATWEWRHHLGVGPEQPPTGPAETSNQLRILHNVAVSRGDATEAERIRALLSVSLDRTVEAHWEGGHTLVGIRVTTSVQPRLEMWFEAGGPTSADTTFSVHSQIIAKNPLSWIPKNDVIREMAYPPALSTALWRKGYLYVLDCVLNHRIGIERYTGRWNGGPPRRAGAPAEVELVTLR